MSGDILKKIIAACAAVEKVGHGSVEIIYKNGKVLDIVKKERERIE